MAHPHEALPSVPENLCPISRQGAECPPLRKAESRRAMADVLDRGVRSRSEKRRAGSTARAHAERLAQGPGHDVADPKAGALSRRVFDRGVRAAAPREVKSRLGSGWRAVADWR